MKCSRCVCAGVRCVYFAPFKDFISAAYVRKPNPGPKSLALKGDFICALFRAYIFFFQDV